MKAPAILIGMVLAVSASAHTARAEGVEPHPTPAHEELDKPQVHVDYFAWVERRSAGGNSPLGRSSGHTYCYVRELEVVHREAKGVRWVSRARLEVESQGAISNASVPLVEIAVELRNLSARASLEFDGVAVRSLPSTFSLATAHRWDEAFQNAAAKALVGPGAPEPSPGGDLAEAVVRVAALAAYARGENAAAAFAGLPAGWQRPRLRKAFARAWRDASHLPPGELRDLLDQMGVSR